MKDLPAFVPRLGLVFPAIAFGAGVLASTFGRPTCFGRACVGPGSGGYDEIVLSLLAIGGSLALGTVFNGPARWKGGLGLLLALATVLAPSHALEIPALRSLWP